MWLRRLCHCLGPLLALAGFLLWPTAPDVSVEGLGSECVRTRAEGPGGGVEKEECEGGGGVRGSEVGGEGQGGRWIRWGLRGGSGGGEGGGRVRGAAEAAKEGDG